MDSKLQALLLKELHFPEDLANSLIQEQFSISDLSKMSEFELREFIPLAGPRTRLVRTLRKKFAPKSKASKIDFEAELRKMKVPDENIEHLVNEGFILEDFMKMDEAELMHYIPMAGPRRRFLRFLHEEVDFSSSYSLKKRELDIWDFFDMGVMKNVILPQMRDGANAISLDDIREEITQSYENATGKLLGDVSVAEMASKMQLLDHFKPKEVQDADTEYNQSYKKENILSGTSYWCTKQWKSNWYVTVSLDEPACIQSIGVRWETRYMPQYNFNITVYDPKLRERHTVLEIAGSGSTSNLPAERISLITERVKAHEAYCNYQILSINAFELVDLSQDVGIDLPFYAAGEILSFISWGDKWTIRGTASQEHIGIHNMWLFSATDELIRQL